MTYIDPRSKLLGHLDRIYAIQAGLNPPPVNIEIDLSNRCSLGCEWCHFAYTHTRGPLAGKQDKPDGATPGGDLMLTPLALGIVSQLARNRVRSITWTGGGEPTLHPDFDRIIGHAAVQDLDQGIYTHGGHIDDQRAALLKQVMKWVYISLDAADADSYKQHKGVDRFDKVCENIRRLVGAPGGATIGLGFLLTNDNWRDYPLMKALGDDLGVDYVQFRPTIAYKTNSPGETDEATDWLKDAIYELAEYSPITGVEVDINRFKMYQNWKGHGYNTCYWSAMQTVITPNGKMWTCVNKREYPGEELGDLSCESFTTIWHRHAVASVDRNCRVMCRGHVANLSLNRIMEERPHKNFI